MPHLRRCTDAERMLGDASMHEWIRKRQRANDRKAFVSQFRRERLRRCFDSLDTDRTGSLTPSELTVGLAALGFGSTRVIECVRSLMLRGDLNGDGKIDFDEFVELCAVASERLGWSSNEKMALNLGEIVDRAAHIPLAIITDTQKISSLVDQYDPDLLDEKTGRKNLYVVQPPAGARTARKRTPRTNPAPTCDAATNFRSARAMSAPVPRNAATTRALDFRRPSSARHATSSAQHPAPKRSVLPAIVLGGSRGRVYPTVP